MMIIIIDSAETHPWSFYGFGVTTEWKSLGRHPNSKGDYSIKGFEDQVGVERKSLEDFQSTVLGFDGRRQRFEKELDNLSKLEASIVIVEASWEQCVLNTPDFGTKPKDVKAKILMRSLIAFEMDYRVPFRFCSSRRAAEVYCYRFFERFLKKRNKR